MREMLVAEAEGLLVILTLLKLPPPNTKTSNATDTEKKARRPRIQISKGLKHDRFKLSDKNIEVIEAENHAQSISNTIYSSPSPHLWTNHFSC